MLMTTKVKQNDFAMAEAADKEIAEEVEELDTHDAADIISELPEERQQESGR